MKKLYYYVEIEVVSRKIVDIGTTTKPTLTGDAPDPNNFRIFIPLGQYNKLLRRLES